MHDVEHALHAIARRQRNLIVRADVLAAGGSDELIETAVAKGAWQVPQAGVYATTVAPLDWHAQLLAGCLAGGPDTIASARAGMLVYGIDGIRRTPPEVTVPYGNRPVPKGVIVHRSRRVQIASVRHGIPVASIEETILGAAAHVPLIVVEKALHSATLLGLTNPEKLLHHIDTYAGRGVSGTRKVRLAIANYGVGAPARSGGEVELLALIRDLREVGIEEPLRNYAVQLPSGLWVVLDLAWPLKLVGVEFDGKPNHTFIRDVDWDDRKRNELADLGWQLRCFGFPTLKRDRAYILRTMSRLLL